MEVPRRNATLITIVVVIAGLYFAKIVLIPFALAVLISFLLAPLVIRLRRWGWGRIPSVLTVVTMSFVAATLMAGLVSLQLADFASKMPEYQENIRIKLHSVRQSSSGVIQRFTSAAQELSNEFTPAATPPQETPPGEVKPVPVEIRGTAFSPLSAVRKVLGSLIHVLLLASIVVVYVIFMLFQREDLRDRLIRLMGAGQINATTSALDDAAHRVSRYLLAQLALNVGYGVLAGIGLFFLKVPNPVLWGVLAALLRYVPYLGIWLAAAMPAAVSLAVSSSWLDPLWIFVLFFGIDIFVLNFAEPFLYGNSTGISPMAILVAAVFWTWLWGPIGLLLATPLTVCLAVLGRYVPSLEFLSIALSDEPVLTPEKRFYQRLLARDIDEASDLASEYLLEKPLEDLYDQVIIPALCLAETEAQNGKLTPSRERFVLENTRILVEDLGNRADATRDDEEPVAPEEMLPDGCTVLCVPARDQADEIAAIMLSQLLRQKKIAARTTSVDTLASECVEKAGRGSVRVACICMVPPQGYTHVRYLCKRLRSEFPKLKLVAAALNEPDTKTVQNREPALEADAIAVTLTRATAEVQMLSLQTPEPAAAS
jgi:predicted PurR-regulated permease PerM